MIFFPSAKINLGLQVIEKRPDQYHNIASVVAPVSWFDVLEFQISDQYNLTTYGIDKSFIVEENLVTQTWKILNKRFNIPPLEIHLYKSIPVGAGLGGGSSDAAFLIKKVNEEFKLDLNTSE
jgi:4-diphosphocytidyl-2-C-methyl-D-erythritol kinase